MNNEDNFGNKDNSKPEDKQFDAEWNKFANKWNELKEFDRMDKEWKERNKPKPKK